MSAPKSRCTTPAVRAAIEAAQAAAGGQLALAQALGVSQQAVSAALNGVRWMPVPWARAIERLYGLPAAGLVNPEKVL